MAITFNWNNLRHLHTGIRDSFEELCAVLAHRDPRFRNKPDHSFVRNGRPDGGTECYWQSSAGEVHGYQAKYFMSSLEQSQWTQISDSLEQAINKYPTLRTMVVCIPIDLPNSPGDGRSTAQEKWTWTVGKAKALAAAQCRSLEVIFWGSHQLTDLLATPENSGVLAFFFDDACLKPDEMALRLKAQLKRAGPRYQPSFNIATSLESEFSWMICSEAHREALRTQLSEARNSIDLEMSRDLLKAWTGLEQRVVEIKRAIDKIDVVATTPSMGAFGTHKRSLDNAISATSKLLNDQREQILAPLNGAPERERDAKIKEIDSITGPLFAVLEQLWTIASDTSIEVCDKRLCIISGSGGAGKTHLTCKMASDAQLAGVPVFLVYGLRIDAKRPWEEILDSTGNYSTHLDLLKALDVAGEVHRCRSLLIVDALNDATNNNAWPTEVAALSALVDAYPHVTIVLTIRDVYYSMLWPDGSPSGEFCHLVQPGFVGMEQEAVYRYCDYYNITVPDVPVLEPYFSNPLFLSIFCQAIASKPDPDHSRSPLAFPKGSRGFSTIFKEFVRRKETDLKERYQLQHAHPRSSPLASALREIAGEASTSPGLDLPRQTCHAILKRHLEANPPIDNPVIQLESDGLLECFPSRSTNGSELEDRVRFAFDRMGAHFIVDHWLAGKTTSTDAVALFHKGGPLCQFVDSDETHQRAPSICEELFLQWPERFRAELFDDLPDLVDRSLWRATYLSALTNAPSDTFTESSARWLRTCLDREEDIHERAVLVERLLAGRGNPNLVRAIHDYLLNQLLADRDSWWTICISDSFLTTNRDSLLDWAIRPASDALDQDQALSYATYLAWLTSTTNRVLRASATKAIVGVLERSLDAACELLTRFSKVNDPYVLQAVSMAVYGACLRSTDQAAVLSAAATVLSLWKTKCEWPVDLITRHALAGIVELAKHRNPDWAIDLTAVQPPYESAWPEQFPSWETIDAWTKSGEKPRDNAFVHVARSCEPEVRVGSRRMYGDFGRYIIGSASSHFLPRARTTVEKPFEVDAANRFVIERVKSLGWTHTRFGSFDASHGSMSRRESVVERIGKKYQWIALGEFLARAVDRHQIYHHWDSIAPYQFPSQLVHEFGLDTSLLRAGNGEDSESGAAGWWGNKEGEASLAGGDDEAWLLNTDGIPDPKRYIIQTDCDGGRTCGMLWGYLSWDDPNYEPTASGDRFFRRLFLHVHSYAIPHDKLPATVAWLRGSRPYMDNARMVGGAMFGELYWSRAARLASSGDMDDLNDHWEPIADGEEPAPRAIRLCSEYYNESDPTFGRSLHVLCPSRWLVETMGLRAGPREFVFEDSSGKPICWNPSVPTGGRDAVLADVESVSSRLKENDLSLLWVVTGEKNLIGGSFYEGPQWPRIQGLYWLEGDQLAGDMSVLFDPKFRQS